MKAYSLVKFEGLKNPAKNPAELQNANLSRPSDEQRQKNLDDTRQALNISVQKKIEPAYVSDLFQSGFSIKDV